MVPSASSVTPLPIPDEKSGSGARREAQKSVDGSASHSESGEVLAARCESEAGRCAPKQPAVAFTRCLLGTDGDTPSSHAGVLGERVCHTALASLLVLNPLVHGLHKTTCTH